MEKSCARALPAIIALMLAAPAMAIERIETPQTDCATIQAFIARSGEAILRYPSTRVANYTLYDRYVSDDRFCRRDERTDLTSVPSRDNPSCRVYTCEIYEPLIEFLD